jgi:hypothetical protein
VIDRQTGLMSGQIRVKFLKVLDSPPQPVVRFRPQQNLGKDSAPNMVNIALTYGMFCNRIASGVSVALPFWSAPVAR